MKNNKSWLPLLLVVMVAIAIALAWGWIGKGKSDNSITNSNDKITSEIKGVVYRKGGELGTQKQGELFSTDLRNQNTVNLSDVLQIPEWTDVAMADDQSTVGFVTRTNGEQVMWLAKSDGSSKSDIFRTNDTGCNVLRVPLIQNEGKSVLFFYEPFVQPEAGGTCVPKGVPELSRGYHYLKIGSSKSVDLTSEDYMVRGYYNDDVLLFDLKNEKPVSVSTLDPITMERNKLFDIPTGIKNVFVRPGSNIVVYTNIDYTPNDEQSLKSEIGLFDYKTGAVEVIARTAGSLELNQGIIISPGGKNIIYRHEIHALDGPITKTVFYVYNVETKKLNELPFSSGDGAGHLSVLWLDDNSFIYRLPLQEGWPPHEAGSAMLFDLKTFKSELLFGPVTEIYSSRMNY